MHALGRDAADGLGGRRSVHPLSRRLESPVRDEICYPYSCTTDYSSSKINILDCKTLEYAEPLCGKKSSSICLSGARGQRSQSLIFGLPDQLNPVSNGLALLMQGKSQRCSDKWVQIWAPTQTKSCEDDLFLILASVLACACYRSIVVENLA